MQSILFVSRHDKAATLAEQATFVFKALGIERYEERFSANYPPDEHYFLGSRANILVSVCESDGTELQEYPYWVVLKESAALGKSSELMKETSSKVAEELLRSGFNVFIS